MSHISGKFLGNKRVRINEVSLYMRFCTQISDQAVRPGWNVPYRWRLRPPHLCGRMRLPAATLPHHGEGQTSGAEKTEVRHERPTSGSGTTGSSV